MAERLRVFVSSRMRELAKERAAVERALEEAGADAFVFEGDAGARPGPAVATYRDELARCDVYLGIFWLGYGDYTRDEYDTAVRLDLPCLIYEKPPGSGKRRDPELQRFLDEVGDVDTGHVTTAWFDSAEQLGRWVRRDLDRLRTEALRRQIHAGAYRYRHGRLGGRIDAAAPVVKLRRPPRAACPAAPSPFVDRERPLQRIGQALDAGERLVGFRGEPGMGKTALLARLAEVRAAAHPDGAVCIAGGDHAARRDVLVDVWGRFHETATPYVPDDARLAADLAGRRALVAVDDVGLAAGEVQQLAADLPGSAVAVAAAPAEGLDSLAYVKALQVGGFDEPAHTLALFEAEYGAPVPPELRDRLVALCDAAGGGPGHVKRLANLAWGSDASLADWLARQHAAAPAPARSLRALAVAGPGVAVPAGVATRMGVPAADLAALEAGGLIRAASPRYVVDGAAWAGAGGAADLLPDAFRSTVDWVGQASAEEIAGSRAFVVEMLRWGRANGRDAEVVALARAVEGPFALAGWWGAWGLALDAAAAAGGDRATAAWVDHQRGTRLAGLGRLGEARALLDRAVQARVALGDEDAAALSRHNLARVTPVPPPPPPPPPPPRPPWWVLGLVAAAVAGAATILALMLLGGGSGVLAADADPLDVSAPVGQSATGEVTLTNRGDAAVRITGAELVDDTGQFGLADRGGCDGRLPAGGTCRLQVKFTPASPGKQSAELRVSTTEDLLTVAIVGLGTAGDLELSPGAVDFGTVPVGQASEPREVTLTNPGNEPLALDRVAIDGPAGVFALDASACGPALEPDSSCTLAVTFSPPAGGGHAATLLAEGSGLQASAELRGAGEGGRLETDPAVVDFEGVTVGDGRGREVAVRNRGPGAVTISSVDLAGDGSYRVAEDGCGGRTLGDGDTCALLVEFRPAERGPALGGVELVADGEETRVALIGSGLQGDVLVSPADILFGDVEVGSSARRVVTVRNVGNGDLVVTDLGTAPEAFSLGRRTDCPQASLAPDDECRLEVEFAPRAAGEVTGTLEVAAQVDATGVEVETVSLRGAALEPAPGEAAFSEPPVEDLDGQPAIRWVRASASETREVEITNVGGGPLLMQFRIAWLDDPPFEPVPVRTGTTLQLRPVPPITLAPGVTVPDDLTFLPEPPFAITERTCAGDVALAPGDSCRLAIEFSPANLGGGEVTVFARLDVAYLQGIGPDPQCCLLVGSNDPLR